MKLKKKPVIVTAFLLAALGVATFKVATPDPTTQFGDYNRSEARIAVHDSSLNISESQAFPVLTHYEGRDTNTECHIWASYNEDAIRLVSIVNDTTTSVEVFLADLEDPEIFYQIIVNIGDKKVDYYKYVGGMWVRTPIIKRSFMDRVTWDEIDTIDLSVKPDRVDITIPWDAMVGINPKDKIGFQFIRNETNTRYVDSTPKETSVLDRGNWNQLVLEP